MSFVYCVKSLLCLEYYALDPCHYFRSPKLSWYAMLKTTGVEEGIRKGISYMSKRYRKANNKCKNSHNDSKHITCGHILMQIICMVGQLVNIFVSVKLIKWLNQKEIDGFYLNLFSEKRLS